jgi:hypothetical protein
MKKWRKPKLISKKEIPSESLLYNESGKYDYTDAYVQPLKRQDVASWELVAAFFMSAPKWVDHLMVLRNKLVSLIGLKGGGIDPTLLSPPYSKGQQIGVFKIQEITQNEVVLGERDRHLDFKTSLLVSCNGDDELVVCTVVRINNLFGKLYFLVVKPIHRIIVPIMIKAMARNIDEKLLPQYEKSTI